jgi:hypothetical protein
MDLTYWCEQHILALFSFFGEKWAHDITMLCMRACVSNFNFELADWFNEN